MEKAKFCLPLFGQQQVGSPEIAVIEAVRVLLGHDRL